MILPFPSLKTSSSHGGITLPLLGVIDRPTSHSPHSLKPAPGSISLSRAMPIAFLGDLRICMDALSNPPGLSVPSHPLSFIILAFPPHPQHPFYEHTSALKIAGLLPKWSVITDFTSSPPLPHGPLQWAYSHHSTETAFVRVPHVFHIPKSSGLTVY